MLYIPKGVLLILSGNIVHAGGYCFGQDVNKTETDHHLQFFICPNKECKADVDKGKNHSLIDERYSFDEEILSHLQDIILDKL